MFKIWLESVQRRFLYEYVKHITIITSLSAAQCARYSRLFGENQ